MYMLTLTTLNSQYEGIPVKKNQKAVVTEADVEQMKSGMGSGFGDRERVERRPSPLQEAAWLRSAFQVVVSLDAVPELPITMIKDSGKKHGVFRTEGGVEFGRFSPGMTPFRYYDRETESTEHERCRAAFGGNLTPFGGLKGCNPLGRAVCYSYALLTNNLAVQRWSGLFMVLAAMKTRKLTAVEAQALVDSTMLVPGARRDLISGSLRAGYMVESGSGALMLGATNEESLIVLAYNKAIVADPETGNRRDNPFVIGSGDRPTLRVTAYTGSVTAESAGF